MWTKEQDEQLKDWVEENGHDWQHISEALGKTKTACRLRYHRLSSVRKRQRWSKQDDQALREAIESSFRTSATSTQLWLEVGKILHRAPLACQSRARKWKKSTKC